MNEPLFGLSLTLNRPFRFESKGSTENIAHALKLFARDSSGPVFDTVSMLPIAHGYSFHYEVRRWDKNSRACTTAVGDGKIWQRANGTVVVQGAAHVDPWGFYGAMSVSALLCLTTALSMPDYAILWGLVFLILITTIGFIYSGDRNRIVRVISEVLVTEERVGKTAA